MAAVALKSGAVMSEADVMALLGGRIARYKQPREVRFVAALPRSSMGKVKKQELRAALALGHGIGEEIGDLHGIENRHRRRGNLHRFHFL